MMSNKGLNDFLGKLINRHQVPGASLAILRDDKIVRQAQSGLVNFDSGVKVTPDAVFQIGSITKAMTATVLMQLVDQGLVDLDASLQSYLPEWNRSRATVRQLMCHVSGVEGDFNVDSGRGEEAIKRYVDKGTMLPSLFEPGEMMSYCNLGYAVLGRLIEVITGKPFDAILVERLFEPLGMQHAFASPEHAIRFNCAVGHVQSGQTPSQWHVTDTPYLSFGQAAAGSIVSTSAADLLKFAQLHLNKGRNQDGAQILSRSSVREMQRRQVRMPKHTRFGINGWGLGWSLMRWDGTTVYGHTGATLGQFSFLCVIPGEKLAIVLLTNGGGYGATSVFEDICTNVIKPICKVAPPGLPDVSNQQRKNVKNYIGSYQNTWVRIDILKHNGMLHMQQVDLSSGQSGKRLPLGLIDRNTARVDTDNPDLNREVLIFSKWDESNQPQYLQIDLRQLKRVSSH